MRNLISLAKITVKVDTKKEVTHPVKEMILHQIKDVPDEYVVKFSDVKQAYPEIADKLKSKIFQNKNTLSVKDIKLFIKDMDVTDDRFWLSEVPYQSSAQKKFSDKQYVIQFNFTPDMIAEIRKSKPTYEFLAQLFATKEGSMHPLNNKTFAWARVYKFTASSFKIWVIEEMQSDFIGWDSGFKSMTKEQQNYFDKFDEKNQKEIMDFFKKNFDKWEHKFLATIMQMARSEGVEELQIFDESEKGGEKTSPSKLKWFYRTVPKNMGMKLENQNLGGKDFKVWKKVLAKLNPKVLAALTKIVNG